MRTYILIGASNVTISLPLIWHSLAASPEPSRVIVVAGHGRSYGKPSSVLGRTLPGILQSEFWEQLPSLIASDSDVRTLVTDVGNDILYGMKPRQISSWVRDVLTQLQPFSQQTAVFELPLCSLARLSRWRFWLCRRVLFPKSQLSFEEALSFGTELNTSVQEVAREFQVATIVPQAHWYGFDPIHIRSGQRVAVWRQSMQLLDENFGITRPSLKDSFATWGLTPALRWEKDKELHTEQPVARLNNHELWLY